MLFDIVKKTAKLIFIFFALYGVLVFYQLNAQTPPFGDTLDDWSGLCIGGGVLDDDLWAGSCRVTVHGKDFVVRIRRAKGDPVVSNFPRQPMDTTINLLAAQEAPAMAVNVSGLAWFKIFPRSLEIQSHFRSHGNFNGERETRIVRITEGREPGVVVATFE